MVAKAMATMSDQIQISAAVSLWEPWASLWVGGPKTIETRTWPFPPRFGGQWIAVHAAKRWTGEQVSVCRQPRYADALREIGFRLLPRHRVYRPAPRTLGCFVGAVRLLHNEHASLLARALLAAGNLDELAFGDYSLGRWGWLTSDRRRIATPILGVGRQGFWNPPADVMKRIERELNEVSCS